MSKHLGRKRRWTQETPNRHSSALGAAIFERNGWFGLLDYRLRTTSSTLMPTWTDHHRRLGPFKRPRNAMVAIEEEVTILRNRHGPDVLIGDELWAESGK
jgi:hypothetical protein